MQLTVQDNNIKDKTYFAFGDVTDRKKENESASNEHSH
jgi:hypothetical protein